MDDADPRRYDAEGIESLHAPLQELVALAIALELATHVLLQRLRRPVVIDLDRVVDDQIDRHQRFDAPRIEPALDCHLAHRRQIAEQRHAGEVLQDDARNDEGNLLAALRPGSPLRQLDDVPLTDPQPVAVTQQRLEDDAQRHRQAIDMADTGSGQCRQRVVQGLRLTGRGETRKGAEWCAVHACSPERCGPPAVPAVNLTALAGARSTALPRRERHACAADVNAPDLKRWPCFDAEPSPGQFIPPWSFRLFPVQTAVPSQEAARLCSSHHRHVQRAAQARPDPSASTGVPHGRPGATFLWRSGMKKNVLAAVITTGLSLASASASATVVRSDFSLAA